MKKREQQRQDRKNQILMCSLDMLISRGYEAMKIRDIANELGISTGLFFNYFESKEKIYEELISYGLKGPENILAIISDETSPTAILEKMSAAIFNALKSDSMTAKMFVLMSQSMKTEAIPERIKEMLKDFDSITPVIPLIQRGQELGEIKAGDPAALAVAYWGAVQGIAEIHAMQPELPLPESNWVVDILRIKRI